MHLSCANEKFAPILNFKQILKLKSNKNDIDIGTCEDLDNNISIVGKINWHFYLLKNETIIKSLLLTGMPKTYKHSFGHDSFLYENTILSYIKKFPNNRNEIFIKFLSIAGQCIDGIITKECMKERCIQTILFYDGEIHPYIMD